MLRTRPRLVSRAMDARVKPAPDDYLEPDDLSYSTLCWATGMFWRTSR